MMKVYDEMVEEWPHAKREWFDMKELVEGRRVWMVCKKGC